MEEDEAGGVEGSISVLPEGCISEILSLTSPGDASRASAISVGFKLAADSDAVWQRFLPPDYPEIIARSVSPVVFDTKKELYFLLCDSPILIDGGKLLFWLAKLSGKKCYMMGAKELSIAWDDDRRYWEWRPIPESRFSQVAVLNYVFWLEVRGKVEARMLSPETTYTAYLVFRLDAESSGLDALAKASVRFLHETEQSVEAETSNVCLETPSRRSNWFGSVQECDRLPKNRMDGWMEIELGEFYNDKGDDGQVEMMLKETEQLHWKSGLIVEGIELRPKENA